MITEAGRDHACRLVSIASQRHTTTPALPSTRRTVCATWSNRSNMPIRLAWTCLESANTTVGEYLDSAPAVILGAAAARTHHIRRTSAVTVLSSADPVPVFQNFATQGRAEMVVGRG